MPNKSRYVPLRAALDVLIYTDQTPPYSCRTIFYFDTHRATHYASTWQLKTQAGAFERQRRETIQYLTDLRNQIDEVLIELESVKPDDNYSVRIPSSAYAKE
jgi:hypothetical protein